MLKTTSRRREKVGRAAELRAKYGLRTPDAIQLASVIYKKGDVLITNDKGLKRVKEIKVLALEDI